MKLQLLAMSCMVATAAAAHDNLAVKYKVSNRDTDAGNIRTTEMTLVADNEKSLYYNTMSLYVDSCMSTPERDWRACNLSDYGRLIRSLRQGSRRLRQHVGPRGATDQRRHGRQRQRRSRQRLGRRDAHLLLAGYPGPVTIYYGDESKTV